MNKVSTLILVLASTFSFGQERSEYYAGLPFWESPVQPFKGEYPLLKEQAQKRVHLRLDYDKLNRISEVSVRIGKEYKEFEGFFGNLYINAPLTKVLYDSHSERHHFFDRFGNRISVMNNVHEKVYEKDEYGRNISLHFVDEKGQLTTDLFKIKKYEWQYLRDGSIIEIRKNDQGEIVPLRGGFEFLRTRIVYGVDGNVSSLQNVDEKNELLNAPCGAALFNYFYDKYGRFSRWEVYTKDGKKGVGPSSTSGEQNIFENHYLKNIVFFDSLGNAATHWSGVEQWNFEYDSYGNITRLNFQDAAGGLKNSENGYASIQYQWTADGRFLLSQEYRDNNDKLIEHPISGVARLNYKRNNEGLIVEITYIGKDGKNKNRKDNGAATVRYKYDSNNIRSNTQLFDTNNNEIK